MTTFTGVEERWAQGLGSLRDVVRQHLVAEQVREVLAGHGPLHVLDAGCGQGTQALVTRLLTALTAVAAQARCCRCSCATAWRRRCPPAGADRRRRWAVRTGAPGVTLPVRPAVVAPSLPPAGVT